MASLKLSFAAKVFMSLIAGAICGLFFEEMALILAPIGTIFIKLMQVTVLPSVVIFIITGIGSINKDDAKDFLKKTANSSNYAANMDFRYNRILFHAIGVSQCVQPIFFQHYSALRVRGD